MDNNSTIKDSYQAGYSSFSQAIKNERGFWVNPPNPHKKNSQFNREWSRGYNDAYFANLKKVSA